MSSLSHVAESSVHELHPHLAGERKKRTWSVVGLVGRILLCLVFGLPLLFMIISSFKPDNQIFADLTSAKAFLPVGRLSLDNYTGVFGTVPFGQFLFNSILISVCTVVLGLIVNSMAAFALARLKFRGKMVILTVIIATLIVPFETLALPLLWWVNKLPWLDVNGFSLGWLDTYRVQILPFVANAFSIFLFYQFFDSIPKELDEAAVVDGAGWFHIYRKIVMPLSGPAIATVAILTFLPAWNSYLWPLMVVQSENLRPAMVGIDYFKQLNVSWGQLMAYATMITVPVLALFVAFQRSFINSIASSGVKG
ncbi:carbohydrate ABC transporter membrane protein 2, CUT1 family [Nakamurella panacisegetis]|uniref:Carbohydrate ABC transporter membrane protein 2, CUT1 family n=1 Tax=Nakamurella panacisegetis TaxID=1090615 RepID=A0A1H0T053_9ACTN|nr:carbohydrate ABC transporter permease [Nakamurella panacisegetis]SDP47433.1 carbohydrate ABC transporter membrane protein 2, CUT1 family [Nakamurella panacisegetis]